MNNLYERCDRLQTYVDQIETAKIYFAQKQLTANPMVASIQTWVGLWVVSAGNKKTHAINHMGSLLAERVGFEPTVLHNSTPDFESGAIDHSTTSPAAALVQVEG